MAMFEEDDIGLLDSMGSKNPTAYCGNLPFNTEESELEKLFQPFGRVLNVKRYLPDGKFRGVAFIEMERIEDVEEAVKALDKQIFGERTLKVSVARYKKPLSSKPPARERKRRNSPPPPRSDRDRYPDKDDAYLPRNDDRDRYLESRGRERDRDRYYDDRERERVRYPPDERDRYYDDRQRDSYSRDPPPRASDRYIPPPPSYPSEPRDRYNPPDRYEDRYATASSSRRPPSPPPYYPPSDSARRVDPRDPRDQYYPPPSSSYDRQLYERRPPPPPPPYDRYPDDRYLDERRKY